MRPPLSRYAIFGEASRAVDPGFVHVEKVRARWDLHHGFVERHSHPHLHQLSLWTNGEGDYLIEQDRHPLKSAMISWIPRSTVHGFEIGGDCDATVISFSDEFLRTELAGILPAHGPMNWRTPLLVEISTEAAGEVGVHFEALLREYASTSRLQQKMIGALLQLIFIAFVRLAEVNASDVEAPAPDVQLLRKFLALLESDYRTLRTIAGYAKALETTPYLLNKVVQTATGQRPSALIRQHLILEAKRLLIFTALQVSEVSYALGFDDPAHFGRLFRRDVGISPAAWRSRERQKLA